jgi:hemolysin activation/secretion protein
MKKNNYFNSLKAGDEVLIYNLKIGLNNTSLSYRYNRYDKSYIVSAVIVKDLGESGKEIRLNLSQMLIFATKESVEEWGIQLSTHSKRLLLEKYGRKK